ncbi:MAG TPA: biopolymer transporter ExbD [Prolixibacteraceae bacterium]|nr:biopolymer transporter ExbD [Bacteroidales bacterium]HNZ71591.1 biopolymer transporter ExbD [Prolixibacteraceae bacterium]
MPRKMPEIPSASLADIAFLLLIFFLVTTTMDQDKGLERRLPQWVPEDQMDQDAPPIKERNIFVVLIDKENRLMVEGEICRVEDLKEKAKLFLTNPLDLPNMPETEVREFDIVGNYKVISKSAVISLRNDVGTTYGAYIQVQNELVAAINELRQELAMDKFGKSYVNLSTDEQKIIQDIYPQKISEAEPKRIGGAK